MGQHAFSKDKSHSSLHQILLLLLRDLCSIKEVVTTCPKGNYLEIPLQYYNPFQCYTQCVIAVIFRHLLSVSFRKLSKNAFERKIKQTLFEIQASEDCYIDLQEIVQKVNLNLFSSL